MARQSLLSVLLDLNADGFEKGLHKAQRSMRRTANQMKRSGAKLTRNVTAPLAIIGASSFKAASEFEASMAKVKELRGHTSRVLHLAASPDGKTVVSGAGDETLRFWNVFAGEKAATQADPAAASHLATRAMHIR